MTASAPPGGECRNCGAPAPGAYCPSCGQETALHPPSAREFLHEFIGHYVALEGALWRTLKALASPGKLTLEYFAGRRRQYIPPIRLYLTASLLFFVVAKVIAPQANVRVVTLDEVASGASAPTSGITIGCRTDSALCRAVQVRLTERYGDLTRERLGALMRDRLVALSAYAMFLLVPLFAAITRAAYWRRPRNYGEHLVFALHVHAAAFLVGTLAVPARLLMIETVLMGIYLAVAMGRVFGGRTGAHVLRFSAVFVIYFVSVLLAVVLMATAALFL